MTEAETAVREALAKMTPGEWGIWVEPCAHPTSAVQELIQQVEHTDPFIGALYLLDAGGKCPAITGCGPTSADNAAGIVALKNHTPALLAELDAARAEVARLRASIDRQAAAVRTLHANEETEINRLRRKQQEWHQAIATLDSERQANAMLTAEVERLRHTATDLLQHVDWLTKGLPGILESGGLNDEEGLIGAAIDAANVARAALEPQQ